MKQRNTDDVRDALSELETTLYQIHALGHLVAAASNDFEPLLNNETSDPLVTAGQIIQEKAKICLEAMQKISVHSGVAA